MKESKSSATIRRRRQHTTRSDLASRSHFRSLSSSSSSGAANDNEDDDAVENDVGSELLDGPRVLSSILSSEWTLFCGLLAFRCLNALVVQTSYVPDEYWQSIEVAHRMSFGYGFLTWEWRHGLRSYVYPLLFSAPYKMLQLLHLDYRLLLIKLPRLLQACLAALGDLYVYKLTRRLSGSSSAHWTLLCQLTSWFNFYCTTRTLTNSSEAVFTAVALYYYPWPRAPRLPQWKFIMAAGVAVILRPTAAVTWLPLGAWLLYRNQHSAWKLIKYIAELGLLLLVATSMIDRLFYGHWVSVQYNFVQFNVLSDLGRIYGSHPAHWYLTQGLPVVLTTHLVILLVGLWYNVAPVFLAVIGWSVAVYSALSHKEFRFMLGVMPLIMHVCGRTLHLLVKSSQPIRSLDTSNSVSCSSADAVSENVSAVSDCDTSSQTETDVIRNMDNISDKKSTSSANKFESTNQHKDKNSNKSELANQISSNKRTSLAASEVTATSSHDVLPRKHDLREDLTTQFGRLGDVDGKQAAGHVVGETAMFSETSRALSTSPARSPDFSSSGIKAQTEASKADITLDSQSPAGNIGSERLPGCGAAERVDTGKGVRVVWLKRLIVVVLLVVNIPISLYTCLIHQRGTVDVMTFLYQESYRGTLKGSYGTSAGSRGTPSESLGTPAHGRLGGTHGTPTEFNGMPFGSYNTSEEMSVLFLMPCHSTPYYSYLHRNVTMRFLSCEPNLQQRDDHVDVADKFYLDPASWLSANLFNQSHASQSNNATNQWPFENNNSNSAANQNLPDIKQKDISVNQDHLYADHSKMPDNQRSQKNSTKAKVSQLDSIRREANHRQSNIYANDSSANHSASYSRETTADWLNVWDDTLPHCGSVAKTAGLPTHIVMFDELLARVGTLLRDFRYRQCFRAFHTHFPEGRVSSHVVVMCR